MIGILPEAELIHIILTKNGRNPMNIIVRIGIRICGINPTHSLLMGLQRVRLEAHGIDLDSKTIIANNDNYIPVNYVAIAA